MGISQRELISPDFSPTKRNNEVRVPECPPWADVSKGKDLAQCVRPASIHSDCVGALGMVGEASLRLELQILGEKCGLDVLTSGDNFSEKGNHKNQ